MQQKSDHDMITEMHSILCDTNGNEGLCTQFRKHQEGDQLFRRDYYNFKRLVLIVFAVAVSGGGLTFGIMEAVRVFAR